MKKKILALMLVVVLGMTMLSGCAQVFYKVLKKQESTTDDYVYDPYTEEEFTEEEQTEEEDTEEVDTEEAEDDEKKKESGSADVDFEVAEASLDNPAQIGEWVATKVYSAEAEKNHTIYYRITNVIRGDEAEQIVEDYNNEDHMWKLNELEYDQLEYGIVEYEVHYPADFPQGEYGIYNVGVDLDVCNYEDGSTFDGLMLISSNLDISEQPDEFYAGDTFTGGRMVFAMLEDYSDYLFYAKYYADEENYEDEQRSYVQGK